MLTFHCLLTEMGKHWNAVNKTVEDCRDAQEQLPDDDTLYFCVTSIGDVRAVVVKGILDRQRFRIGNFFHTREEAEAAAERVKKALKGI